MTWLGRVGRHGGLGAGRSAACAVALVVVTFPDVIFLGATLSPSDTYNIQYPNYLFFKENPDPRSGQASLARPTLSLYPERTGRLVIDGISDAGGAVWQSEPAALFMKYVIQSRESPYWNPYSGAGSLGPETLIDVKFSPFSILHALSGGGSLAFHVVLLSLYAVALFFLFRTLDDIFGLTSWACLAGGVVYLLNGYNVANLCSNVTQVYLYFPMSLYCICAFARRPTARSYLFLVLSTVPIWSTSFLPTTLLTLTTLYAIAAACAISFVHKKQVGWRGYSGALWSIGLQASAALVSFLLMAFMYFPIVESFGVVDASSMYSARVFYPVNVANFVSCFTPKHFWESYNAIDPVLWQPGHPASIGNVAFHFGIGAAIVGANASGALKPGNRAIVLTVAALMVAAIGRIFAVPGIFHAVDVLPRYRDLGCQYWWMVVGITMPLLVAWGMDGLLAKGRGQQWTRWFIAALIAGSLVYTFSVHGWPDRPSGSRYLSTRHSHVYVLSALGMIVLSMVACALIGRRGKHVTAFRAALVALVFIELTSYMNHVRYKRHDYVRSPPVYVTMLKERIGHHRIFNIGLWGLPPDYGEAFQIQQLGSMSMNVLPRYLKFYQENFVPDPAERWGLFATSHYMPDKAPTLREEILDLMGVKYVIVPASYEKYQAFFAALGYTEVFKNSGIMILENPDPYPRMFVVGSLVRGGFDAAESLAVSRVAAYTTDERLLEEAGTLGIQTDGSPAQGDGPTGTVELREYAHTRIVATAELTRPGVVVLMDNWHPNWNAEIEGRPAYIGIVNGSFRGIALPAGRHEIVMSYRPGGLGAGLIVSGAMVALLGIVVFARRPIDRFLSARMQAADPQRG